MLSLRISFIFCETTISWTKMQIAEQLNLNEKSKKEIDKAKTNTHVQLCYKYCSKKKQWNTKQRLMAYNTIDKSSFESILSH